VKGLLLDTHIWFWYLSGSPRLPAGLRTLIDATLPECWLSPVSAWELGLLAARGRVRLDCAYRKWLTLAHRRSPLQDAAMTREVALRSTELSLGHRDPADHFLAATALTYGLRMVTVDGRMAAAEWLPTVSS
jgi:PIN domain nuclease of toxin-antitoxin system